MGRHNWTPDEDKLLALIYPDTKTSTVAATIGVSTSQAYTRANFLGIRKSAAFLASQDSGRIRDGELGQETRFQPGAAGLTKGMKFGSGHSAATQFKAGLVQGRAAELAKPIGYECVRDGYLVRKINNDLPLHRRWRAVHLIEWEAIHGPVPDGHVLAFRDGNRMNRAADNLVLVSRGALLQRNSIHNYPPELADSMRLVGRIKREVRKQTERHPHEKQG